MHRLLLLYNSCGVYNKVNFFSNNNNYNYSDCYSKLISSKEKAPYV